MTETFYLFIFVDESTYEMTCAVNFRDAVWEMAKYTGCGSELLLKCLKGFEPDDIEGIISIFNHFSTFTISKVYVIEKKIYDDIVTQNQQLLEEYIRFQGALIELGKVGNAFTAELSNEKLAFLQDNVEIAYVSNNKLYITDAEIRNKLTIGNPTNGYFDFIPRANGNLSLKWRES